MIKVTYRYEFRTNAYYPVIPRTYVSYFNTEEEFKMFKAIHNGNLVIESVERK